MPVRWKRKNPIFFTKEGYFSPIPVVVMVAVGVGLTAFTLEGLGIMPHISTAAWVWLGGVTGAVSGGAAFVDRASVKAKSDVEVAKVGGDDSSGEGVD